MKYIIESKEARAVVGIDGAMLNSLVKNGVEYLWQGDKEHWSGQAPICFPIVGVLPNNEGMAFGKKCYMKRHGIARITPFELMDKDETSVTFIQKSNADTQKAYPFDYELKVRYKIQGSTIVNEYVITNTGKEKMPFVIGGHPAFNCPLSSDEAFEDYKIVFDDVLVNGYLRPDHKTGLVDIDKRYMDFLNCDTISVEHNLFEENDAMIFDNIKSKCATLIGPNNLGIKIEYQDMNNLLIWSACNNADFVALEPWSGISNCSDESDVLENKRGMKILNPNETVTYKFKITMI